MGGQGSNVEGLRPSLESGVNPRSPRWGPLRPGRPTAKGLRPLDSLKTTAGERAQIPTNTASERARR